MEAYELVPDPSKEGSGCTGMLEAMDEYGSLLVSSRSGRVYWKTPNPVDSRMLQGLGELLGVEFRKLKPAVV